MVWEICKKGVKKGSKSGSKSGSNMSYLVMHGRLFRR